MISSRRITKLYNKFALLRFMNVDTEQRRVDNINGVKFCEVKYPAIIISRSTSIAAETPVRYLTTSTRPSLLARNQTDVMKGEGDHSLNLDYDDILKAQKENGVLIVDVREDAEINETGKLPGSIHVPMGQTANVLKNLPEKEFLEKYEKPKPTKDTKIIFSCRSGKRSAMVQEEMLKLGYEKSYNYTGGWLDWEKNKQTPKA